VRIALDSPALRWQNRDPTYREFLDELFNLPRLLLAWNCRSNGCVHSAGSEKKGMDSPAWLVALPRFRNRRWFLWHDSRNRPSFATRVTAVGKIHKYIERSAGRNSYFEFSFMPDDGNPINMRSNISFPYWSDPSILDGRKFRLVYLQDSNRFMENEAIDLEIMSGRDAGFHDSLDARPVGIWLAIPIGAAFAIFGFAGLRYMKDDAVSAAEDDDTSA
jgi:hypothetical protein